MPITKKANYLLNHLQCLKMGPESNVILTNTYTSCFFCFFYLNPHYTMKHTLQEAYKQLELKCNVPVFTQVCNAVISVLVNS